MEQPTEQVEDKVAKKHSTGIPKWIWPLIVIISVAFVCLTAVTITYKNEIKSWIQGKTLLSEKEKQKKANEEKRFLQFSKEERKDLEGKKGTVSIVESPLGNIPFLWLGKSLPTPLPKECHTAPENMLPSIKLYWKEKEYDGFYLCDCKNVILWNKFVKDYIIFTKGNNIMHVRLLLKPTDTSDGAAFQLLRKEYDALGYEFAKEYGLPTEEIYEINKGYDDNEEMAFENKRASASREYKAKDGVITIMLEYNNIKVDYAKSEQTQGRDLLK